MFDVRLKVFYTVARRLNFTKAAAELFITQPAVTKQINELERQLNVTLFERSGNKKMLLTPAGGILLQHAEKLFAIYRDIEYDLNLLAERHSGTLRLGASTTIAQYVIPPLLARFHAKFREVKVTLLTGNTEQIEQHLINKNIDLGIVEGMTRNPLIRYTEFMADELVLVTSTANRSMKKETIKPGEIGQYPLLLREHGSGTLEVITHALKAHQVKLQDLQVEMQLGNTEAIKAYLLHSNCLAFLSVRSILRELKENELRIIDVKGLTIDRPFYFIESHGSSASLSQVFMRYSKSEILA